MLFDPIELLLFILPAYAANSAPVLLGGKTPIDKNKLLSDGKRVFGNGKTLRGLVGGIAAGTITGILLAQLDPQQYLPQLAFHNKIAVSFLLSIGTHAGDLLGSFAKRRMGIKQGEPFFIYDQLLFLFTALLFASPIYSPNLEGFVFLILLTFVLHVASNVIANKLHWKKVPW